MATIHPFAPKNNTATLRCTSCGKTTDAACGCGVGYEYIAPANLIKQAIKNNPEMSDMSDRLIGDKFGVSHQTVGRTRKATGPNGPVEPRIGKDGKRRRMPRKDGQPKASRHKPRKGSEQLAASMMLDEGKSRDEVAARTGLGKMVVQLSMERDLGRRETLNELLDAAAADNFTDKGKIKIEDAIRIHKARLDKQFEQRVNDEVRRRIDAANDAVRKHLREVEQQNIALQRLLGQQSLYSPKEFNLLLKCLDSSPFSFRLKDDTEEDRIANRELIKRFDEAMPLIRDNKDRLVNPGKK
jgi:hypothetical protein